MFHRSIMALTFFSLAVLSAHAQTGRSPYNQLQGRGNNPQRGNSQQQQMEKFEGSGTIESLASGRIMFITASNEQWMIGLLPATKLQVVGQANTNFLRAGMFVQFKAELDKRNMAVNPVDELTITSLSKEKTPGMFPIGENHSGDKKKSAGGTFNVIGRLTTMHGNKLQINVGSGTVICELSDKAKIGVDLADISMIRKGDKITVAGIKMRNVPFQAQAAQIKIELAETLTGMGETKMTVKPGFKFDTKGKKE